MKKKIIIIAIKKNIRNIKIKNDTDFSQTFQRKQVLKERCKMLK